VPIGVKLKLDEVMFWLEGSVPVHPENVPSKKVIVLALLVAAKARIMEWKRVKLSVNAFLISLLDRYYSYCRGLCNGREKATPG